MLMRLKAWIAAKFTAIFIKLNEEFDKRYEEKLQAVEKVIVEIESKLKQNNFKDYKVLLASFEALSRALVEIDKQRVDTIRLIESAFPEQKDKFTSTLAVVEFLLAEYKERNKV